jgi:nitrate reductase NapE
MASVMPTALRRSISAAPQMSTAPSAEQTSRWLATQQPHIEQAKFPAWSRLTLSCKEMRRMTAETQSDDSKGKETRLFLFLVIFLFPILAVAIVGGYGFLVWMYQLFAGPPGPPV